MKKAKWIIYLAFLLRLCCSGLSRLCDEKGVLLFDADNLDDLKALSELDAKLISDFNQAMAAELPKALVSEENSN